MEKVIQSLQQKYNALLESPTGTGKTLCLLCATLAWRKSLGGFSTGMGVRSSQSEGSISDVSPSQGARSKLPTIVYASRTHSQIRQVIQELKRTCYRPKMVVLGSREQLCIYDKVSLLRGKTQTNACRMLCRKRGKYTCAHYSHVAGKASRTLSWWCFNPGIALEEFHKLDVGSIILTSGTLSPMDSFALELKLEFPVRLENPHVITPSQIWAGVVSAGPSSCSFNSSYRNRDSVEYKQELGNAIVNFARIVPDGLLVFFSSYYIMDQCIGCWKNMSHANSTTIWERICKHKKPVIEPRQSSMFSLSIEDYMAKLKDTSASGAIFFAVCRGKVSEGLDFADHAGRAVVITGMPFATMNDPKVCLKREYLDQEGQSQSKVCKVLTGEDWYNQQASRAVNQAVGRVIRHRHDYGAIIFCDERFAQPYRQSQISLLDTASHQVLLQIWGCSFYIDPVFWGCRS